MALDSQDNLYVVTEPYDHQLGNLVYKVIKYAALKYPPTRPACAPNATELSSHLACSEGLQH